VKDRPISVMEVDPFERTARMAGLTEDERIAVTVFLAHNPEAGDLIAGTGGLRKLRWGGKGKGKSGGYRVIYYYFNEGVPIFLMAVYPKNRQVDLTPDQRARLAKLAEELKAAAKAPKAKPRRA
jgi:hypothetical protein